MNSINYDTIKLWQPADGHKGLDERDKGTEEEPNFIELQPMDGSGSVCIRTERFVIDEDDLENLLPLLNRLIKDEPL